jgi:hypothetical protein
MSMLRISKYWGSHNSKAFASSIERQTVPFSPSTFQEVVTAARRADEPLIFLLDVFPEW